MKRVLIAVVAVAAMLMFSTARGQNPRPFQYPSSVIDFSSEWSPGPGAYSANQALGSPDAYPFCGDNVNAWCSASSAGQREFLVLGFANPQTVNTVRVYQAVAPGAVDTIFLRDAATGNWHTVYTAVAAPLGDSTMCPGLEYMLLEVSIPLTAYNVDAIRVAINSPAVPAYWNEIDAVGIANLTPLEQNWLQYADSVIAFSTEYNASPGVFSAHQALGAPSEPIIYCGGSANSWTSYTLDGQREFLVVGYSFPAPANRVDIYQRGALGAVDTVYVRDASTGVWHTVYAAAAAPMSCPGGNRLEINFTRTPYPVDAVRIAINSPAINTDYKYIDAVGIRSELPANAIVSAADGPWNAATTWVGGVVPGADDTVMIRAGHDVTVTTVGAVHDVHVAYGGKIVLGSSGALTIGPAGGGASLLRVAGSIENAGSLYVGGSLRFNPASQLIMTAGSLTVDGSNGTAAGSVPDDAFLADFMPGMSPFSFTGGTITVVDPAFGPSGKTLRIPYNTGLNATLRLGNGVSTTAGGHPDGFILTDLNPIIGALVVDAVTTGSNRQVTVGDPLTVLRSCTVTSGRVSNSSYLEILGP